MIKNLIIGGCSFSQTPAGSCNWSVFLRDNIPDVKYVNHARSGAGNNYIADSMIKYLLSARPNAHETLIMIMWTGVGRIDFNIGQEYYDFIGPWTGKECINDNRYVFSTGIEGDWPAVPRSLFREIYKALDYRALASNTLSQIVFLKNFLESHGYAYKFMSYVNYWQNSQDWYSPNLDFSITYYDGDDPLLQDLGNQWIWVNDDKDCLFEFAKSRNMLQNDGFHPTESAQKMFFESVIRPNLQGYIS